MNRTSALGALFAVTALALAGCSAATTTTAEAPATTAATATASPTPTITSETSSTPTPVRTSLHTDEEAETLSSFYRNEVPPNTYGTGDEAYEQYLRNDFRSLMNAMPEVPDYAWIEMGKGACSSLDELGIGLFAMGWNQMKEDGASEEEVQEAVAKDLSLILVSVPTLCPENQSVVDAVFALKDEYK